MISFTWPGKGETTIPSGGRVLTATSGPFQKDSSMDEVALARLWGLHKFWSTSLLVNVSLCRASEHFIHLCILLQNDTIGSDEYFIHTSLVFMSAHEERRNASNSKSIPLS